MANGSGGTEGRLCPKAASLGGAAHCLSRHMPVVFAGHEGGPCAGISTDFKRRQYKFLEQ